jgi:hypothetical protein
LVLNQGDSDLLAAGHRFNSRSAFDISKTRHAAPLHPLIIQRRQPPPKRNRAQGLAPQAQPAICGAASSGLTCSSTPKPPFSRVFLALRSAHDITIAPTQARTLNLPNLRQDTGLASPEVRYQARFYMDNLTHRDRPQAAHCHAFYPSAGRSFSS